PAVVSSTGMRLSFSLLGSRRASVQRVPSSYTQAHEHQKSCSACSWREENDPPLWLHTPQLLFSIMPLTLCPERHRLLSCFDFFFPPPLFAAVPPKLKKLKNPNVNVGEKISLKCEASAGNPQPSYKWYKDGKEMKKSKDIRIKYGNGKKNSRLQFNKVKLEDAGEYSCEAENVLGKDTAKSSLSVRSVTTTLSSWSGHAKKCNESASTYCANGGVCYYIEGINQLSCKCPNGFFGQRCLEKLPLRLYMPDPKQSMFEDKNCTTLLKISWAWPPFTIILNGFWFHV
uniref:Neuregulin 2 n=1 Tax=Sphenodon punctatus TaxID=8508 RepID=A0A8D0LA33_SPHPU